MVQPYEQGVLFPEEMGSQADHAAPSEALPACETPEYTLVTKPVQLERVLPGLHAAPVLSCDTETTGLDFRTDSLRLIQIATPDHAYLFDVRHIPIEALFPLFSTPRRWLFHNAKFDLKFLVSAGCPWPASVFDTMLASQVLKAGLRVRHSLEEVVEQELGRALPKHLQTADWSGELSPAQCEYAARDVGVLWSLYDRLRPALAEAGLERAAEIEFRCVKALAWLELAGIAFDAQGWLARTLEDEAQLESLSHQLHTYARDVGMSINWASSQQIKALFQTLGIELPNARSATLKKIDHPIAELLVSHKEVAKRVSTYGRSVIDSFFDTDSGRVYPVYFQNGTATGRMSCGGPNIQQIPKARAFRTCFCAAPERALIKADYSQVELRIAAALANDSTMLQAFREETDLHALTASRILHIPLNQVEPHHRQLAKSVNFGLLYGMGVNGLKQDAEAKYGVRMSDQEAAQYHRAFFLTYQGVARWHQQAKQQAEQVRNQQGGLETRTLTGRRFLGVRHFNVLLNIPVQGTGGDGLKLALARLFEHRDQVPRATLVACVHDEILVEAPLADAQAAQAWLTSHMVEAMREIVAGQVPIAVEAVIGKNWAGTPLGD